MSTHLSAAKRRAMRKDLIRLRMEMQRQQIKYHAQPLVHPLRQIKQLMNSKSAANTARKTPLAFGITLLLAVFGKRLGRLGTIARIGLAVYPIVRSIQAVSKSPQQASNNNHAP